MATYYWVGGNGTWDNSSTANWSNASGGASGFGPPLSTDTVNFDVSSGTGTCTTAATAAAYTVVLNSSTLGITLGANFTNTWNFDFTLGAINLNNNTWNCAIFNSNNANARSIAFGTGKIVVNGSGGVQFLMQTGTNFSYTGASLIEFTYAGANNRRIDTPRIGSGGTEANALNISITAGSGAITYGFADQVIKNYNFTGFSGSAQIGANIYGNVTLSSGMTLSASTTTANFIATSGIQTLTTNGKTIDQPVTQNNPGATLQLQDNLTMGSTRAFTLTAGDLHINNRTLSTGLFSSSNSNVRVIDFKSGNITLTGNAAQIWNFQTATNFTYLGTPTVNATYSGSTGTRLIYHGSTTGTSTANAISVNVSAGSDTVTLNYQFKDIDFTGFTGTFSNNIMGISGSVKFVSGMTLTAGTAAITFLGTTGTQLITTAGKTLDFPIIFNGVGGTFAFQDALTQGSTRAFTITNGTVQLKASATSTTGAFATSGTNQKYLQSTTPGTQATLTQASGTVNATYLSIKDIVATGGATWNALWSSNNVDEGNNSGWVFGDPPIISAVEYTYALRSFTQPRRF